VETGRSSPLVSIVTRLRAGRLGFDSPTGAIKRFFLFAIVSRPAPRPTPGCWSWPLHLVPRLRMHWAIPPLPRTSSWRGTYLSTRTTVPLPATGKESTYPPIHPTVLGYIVAKCLTHFLEMTTLESQPMSCQSEFLVIFLNVFRQMLGQSLKKALPVLQCLS
jgi:hypothetical protein